MSKDELETTVSNKSNDKSPKKKLNTRRLVIWIASIVGVVAIIVGVGFHHVDEVYHPEESHVIPAVTHTVEHPAETHTVEHPAVTHTTGGGCVRATEGNYAGQCATARCRDGSYTGANPYYSWTCNYHGGVAAVGPFTNPTQTITDIPAYTETVVDKAAWTETVVDEPERTVVDKEAYTTPGYNAWYGVRL